MTKVPPYGLTQHAVDHVSLEVPTNDTIAEMIAIGTGVADAPGNNPVLKWQFENGNAGQRACLTSEDTDVMPYIQVTAATRTGSDVGHAVAGYQLHLGPDTGEGVNREFWYLEAVGENDITVGPHFRMGTFATGTGVKRPFRIKCGNGTALHFEPSNSTIQQYQPIISQPSNQYPYRTDYDGGGHVPFMAIQHSADDTGPQFVIAKTRGTKAAPTAPVNLDVLADILLASHDGTTTKTAALIRSRATESWTFGSAHGTRLEFYVTKNGAASYQQAMIVANPSTSAEAALRLAVNRGGVVTVDQVTVGAPDSAGTGYRILRVPN